MNMCTTPCRPRTPWTQWADLCIAVRMLILAYLEQEPLYKTIDLSKPWNDPANAKALETFVPIFRMPCGGRATEHDDLPGDRSFEWLR